MRSAAKSIRDAYELLGVVGAGQYGQVYCARRRSDDRIVALKELSPQRFPTQSLLRELRFLLILDHPHITRCDALEHGKEGRYLVLEYCEGGTLREWMEQSTPLSVAQIVQWIQQLLQGLAHAHRAGVVHCDVKPENILLRMTATGWALKLTDFGIARAQQVPLKELSMTGSAAYMAPERFYGQFSPRVDLYAAGVILYELLLGSRPFSGSPGQLMHHHLNQRVELGSGIPDPLRPIVRQALEKLPARRYASAEAMARDLEAVLPKLTEPPTCWVGSLLPTAPVQVLEEFYLPLRPEHFVRLGSQCWWSQGGCLWRTELESRETHLVVELETPIQQLQRVGEGIVVVGADRLAFLAPGEPLTPLRQFRDPWTVSVGENHVLWATQRQYGLIYFHHDLHHAIPDTNDPQAPGLAQPLSQSRSFYHQDLEKPLKEPPLLWCQDHILRFGIRSPQRLELWQQPLLPWHPVSWDRPPLWKLPLPVVQGIPMGATGNILLPLDPQAPPIYLNTHPIQARRLYLATSCQAVVSTAQRVLMATISGQLLRYTLDGEGVSQAHLPAPVHHLETDGTFWLCQEGADGTVALLHGTLE